MANVFSGSRTKFMPFRRTKPGIGAENRTTTGKNQSGSRRSTIIGAPVHSSGTLVHFVDPS